jgi:hypothetical protein
MMHPRRVSPRKEYRRREFERMNNSASLAEKFPQLKSLELKLVYFDADGLTKTGEMRYRANVRHAKSVFSFACPNGECVGGDFDLSGVVAQAVSARRKSAEGEVRCPGWHTRPKAGRVPCHNLLRYSLSLGYV